MTRRLVPSAVVPLLLASATIGQAQEPTRAGAVAGRLTLSPTVFVSDRGDSVPAERGQLLVPENRKKPGGRTIELTFIRLKSTSASPGAPIVYLAGGPGGSAQLAAGGKRFPAFMRMREAGDVILYDQRGTWGSGNLQCPTAVGGAADSIARTEAQALSAMRDWSRACVAHWRASGVELAAYNIVESADDIEALRRALGAPHVALWAISYGTQLAQMVVRRHPLLASHLILAGPEPLDAGIKMPRETDAHFARLDSAVRADSQANALIPDFAGLVDTVLNRLERAPARVMIKGPTGDSTPVGLSRFEVQWATAFSFGNSAVMKALPGLYLQMSRGQFAGIAPLVLRLRHYNTTAMTATTDCSTGEDATDLARARTQARTSRFGMAANFPFPELCEDWPVAVLPASARRAAPVRVPTLFVVGSMDGRTPRSNAARMRPAFRQGRELLLLGAAHDDDLIIGHAAIVDQMIVFLRGAMRSDVQLPLPAWTFPVRGR